MSTKVTCKPVRRFKLPNRIDGHHPIGVTFKITGGIKPFRLTVITVNWGRGYDVAELRKTVDEVYSKIHHREYFAILFQEIDEDDRAEEHALIASALQGKVNLVRWETREPIAVARNVFVSRKRKAMTMDQGTAFGGPVGTGPRRYYVSCIMSIMGLRIGLGNQHPHRYSIKNQKVAEARTKGEGIVKNEIEALLSDCDIVIDGGDLNTQRYPKQHPKQRNVYRVGYDYIRSIVK